MKIFKRIVNFVTVQADILVILFELIRMLVKAEYIQRAYFCSLCGAYKLARTHPFQSRMAQTILTPDKVERLEIIPILGTGKNFA